MKVLLQLIKSLRVMVTLWGPAGATATNPLEDRFIHTDYGEMYNHSLYLEEAITGMVSSPGQDAISNVLGVEGTALRATYIKELNDRKGKTRYRRCKMTSVPDGAVMADFGAHPISYCLTIAEVRQGVEDLKWPLDDWQEDPATDLNDPEFDKFNVHGHAHVIHDIQGRMARFAATGLPCTTGEGDLSLIHI